MKKTISRWLLILFYPLIVLVLFVKNYFTWIMLSLLLYSLIWFATENYRLYTQDRSEYTSYLPSLFKSDRKGDKTALHYMVFDLSKLTGGYTAKAPVKKTVVEKTEQDIPVFVDRIEPVSEAQ